MQMPEDVQQGLEGNNGWVIGDLNGFGGACSAGTDLLIRGVLYLGCCIPRYNFCDTLEPIEDGLCTPEASPGKRGSIKLRHVLPPIMISLVLSCHENPILDTPDFRQGRKKWLHRSAGTPCGGMREMRSRIHLTRKLTAL